MSKIKTILAWTNPLAYLIAVPWLIGTVIGVGLYHATKDVPKVLRATDKDGF
jgi:hypothetical protein